MVEHHEVSDDGELIEGGNRRATSRRPVRPLETADVNAADGDGWTALHIAVHSQHLDLTRLLLEHPDIDVNARNRWKSTPLMLAASGGNLDIVESLLRNPKTMVDLQAEYYGRTALIEDGRKGSCPHCTLPWSAMART